jgi:hypothetical protein
VGGGFGQVEDDQAEAACAEEVLGGFGGVVLGSGSDPEHAGGGDAGGDDGFGIERVGGIDPADDLALPRGVCRDGARERGATAAAPSRQLDETPARQPAAEHPIERLEPGRQGGVAAPGRET